MCGGLLWTSGASAQLTSAGQSGAESGKFSSELIRSPGEVSILPRDVKLVAGAGAIVEPAFTSFLPVGPKGAKAPVQTVHVDGGRVDAFLDDASTPRGVLLQGPDKILGISTGGHMVMSVTDESIIIGAVSGDVLVGHNAKFKPLSSGRIRVFPRNHQISKDIDLPAAPELSSRSGLPVAMTGGVNVEVTTNSKNPIRLVVVDSHGQAMGPAVRYEPGEKIGLSLPQAGIYFALARELGEGDLEGPLSSPLQIQVLGLAQGQRAPEEGVFLLDRGERVRLAGTHGLEVRYGSSPEYVPAHSSVGLSQQRVTRVEFRDPKSPSHNAVIVLAPRIMRTEIDLGPAGARWPGKPLLVRVGVWNGAGRLIKGVDEVDVRVTVNSRKVRVNWQGTDQGLTASLAKQEGSGPWVVRVNVYDRSGRPIAREFLEVASK